MAVHVDDLAISVLLDCGMRLPFHNKLVCRPCCTADLLSTNPDVLVVSPLPRTAPSLLYSPIHREQLPSSYLVLLISGTQPWSCSYWFVCLTRAYARLLEVTAQ